MNRVLKILAKVLVCVSLSGIAYAGPKTTAKPAPPPGKTAIHRTVIHSEAYKKREHLGEHVNFKITPPGKRGRKNHVLVEVYNYSKKYINVCSFFLLLTNNWGDRVEVEITVDDLKPSWSALRWVQIPGNKPIPEIDKVEIQNFQLFDDKARAVKLKYYTDLIKQ